MVYETPEAATLAAQARLANEGRPRHEVIVVLPRYEGGFEVGTWSSNLVHELPDGALIVRLP
jgi:hypothetical protein